MRQIEFHAAADVEMTENVRYYEERVQGLGEQFLDEIEEGLMRIQQFPYAWPTYESEYRRYLLKRFPFGLIYRVESEKIFILAVAHLKRRPAYWQGRE